MIDIRRYQRADGAAPLTDWLADLRDARALSLIHI